MNSAPLRALFRSLKPLLGESNSAALSQARARLNMRSNRLARGLKEGFNKGKKQPFPMVRLVVEGRSTFFGYNDRTPFSLENTSVLACATPLVRRSPNGNDELCVGYFKLDTPGRFHEVGSTTTWCWQQGCMLQWFSEAGNDYIQYNRMLHGKHGAVIQAIHKKSVEQVYTRPLYCIAPSGKVGLSLNFCRLHRLRPGYGYPGMDDPKKHDACPEDDGLWRVDLTTGRTDLIVRLAEIANLEAQPDMREAQHYFNHAVFNPAGDRFACFHVWSKGHRRGIRMFTCRPDGTDLYLLTNDQHISHYAWKDFRTILAFSTHPKTGTGFHLYEDKTQNIKPVLRGSLSCDGHPSYLPEKETLLVDEYPDKFGEQPLFVVLPGETKLEVARFPTNGRLYGEFRCDLHPRWDRQGRCACVDSAHESRRCMYILHLPDLGRLYDHLRSLRERN